ncbi:MAG: GNAT family N-acetyltransferase [Bacteroidales bacterium]|nr:GNAT family N-acetyltransferase [Bacteroidales bacterium]MBO7641119.1 GNAT family N-acetyltransferase [Bacteroidales bacterium]
MTEPIIRKAEARDLGAVGRLLEDVLRIHNAGRPDLFRPTGKKYSDEALLAIFAEPQTPVFVYDLDGTVLGYAFCAFQRQEADNLMPITTLYVDDICVDPAARGQGVGRALFDFVKAFAQEQGCHNITLHVWECNPGAKAFYEALGMVPQYTSMELICKE